MSPSSTSPIVPPGPLVKARKGVLKFLSSANALKKRIVQPGTVLTYFDYDNNGSVVRMLEGANATEYRYGSHGLTTAIKPPSEAATYFYYDGRLNRYKQNQAGTISYFVWEGMNLLEERDAASGIKARYTHGYTPIPGIGSVVEVQRVTATTTYYQYLHMDDGGKVAAVTDRNQNTMISYVQDAFGRQLAAAGGTFPNAPNDLVYQANWRTITIGGVPYGLSSHRVYFIPLGRFLSRDTFGSALPAFLYEYVSSNPVHGVDPLGLDEFRVPTLDIFKAKEAHQPTTAAVHNEDPTGKIAEQLRYILRADYEKFLLPKKTTELQLAALKELLDLGCNGLTLLRMGYRGGKGTGGNIVTYPEQYKIGKEAPKCWLSLRKALEQKCKDGERLFVFAKQGMLGDKLKLQLKTKGKVRDTALETELAEGQFVSQIGTPLEGVFNYATLHINIAQNEYIWEWFDYGAVEAARRGKPQHAWLSRFKLDSKHPIVSDSPSTTSFLPNVASYPYAMFCSICIPCDKPEPMVPPGPLPVIPTGPEQRK